jgi:hypothetical protein
MATPKSVLKRVARQERWRGYQATIAEELGTLGLQASPRHVEAWMRLEHPTLDALSAAQFQAEVRQAVDCISAAGEKDSESLALSMGL